MTYKTESNSLELFITFDWTDNMNSSLKESEESLCFQKFNGLMCQIVPRRIWKIREIMEKVRNYCKYESCIYNNLAVIATNFK